MTPRTATALATRLARAIWPKVSPASSSYVNCEWVEDTMAAILQAQAVEDGKDIQEMAESRTYWKHEYSESRKENQALRAFVGRMKTALDGLLDDARVDKQALHETSIRLLEMDRENQALRALVGRMKTALGETNEWISNWTTSFTDDPEWPATREKIEQALADADKIAP